MQKSGFFKKITTQNSHNNKQNQQFQFLKKKNVLYRAHDRRVARERRWRCVNDPTDLGQRLSHRYTLSTNNTTTSIISKQQQQQQQRYLQFAPLIG
jgi:hypothetical protein